MLQSTYLMRVLLAAILLSLTSGAQKLDTQWLRDILSKQGFTGTLQGKVTFSRLGTMRCNSVALEVYYYTWEETNPPGRAIHASYRLIFIEDRQYLGQYVVSDCPALSQAGLTAIPSF